MLARAIINAGSGLFKWNALISAVRRVDMSTWREVAALALFIAGGIAMAILHEKEIALVLAGAAAGYASNNRRGAEKQVRGAP